MPENDDLKLLIDAAKASGDIAMKHWKASPETWDKEDGAGPVTEADLAIDKMLHAELLGNRPDYGWLSEETEDNTDRLNHDRVFIIDPIDGTRAFIAGEKTFSHSLAIAENGVVIFAAVYLPALGRLYAATHDSPSMQNDKLINISAAEDIDAATLLAAKSNLDPKHWQNGDVPGLDRHFRPSLAYRLCLIAEGRFDVMLTTRDCWEWDIAAGDLIVRQAKGVSTDLGNNTLRFNSPGAKTKGCLAAGPALHRLVQERLS